MAKRETKVTSVKISEQHYKALEDIRDKNRKFNLSEMVEALIDAINQGEDKITALIEKVKTALEKPAK